MSKKPSPTPAPEALQTIDPAALQQVSGGASATTSDELTQALTTILSSVQQMGQSQSGSMNPMEMMMMMMVMGQRNEAAAPATYVDWSNPIVHYE